MLQFTLGIGIGFALGVTFREIIEAKWNTKHGKHA